MYERSYIQFLGVLTV